MLCVVCRREATLILPVFLVSLAASGIINVGPVEDAEPPDLPGTEGLIRLVGELGSTQTPGFLGTPIGPRHFLTAAHLAFGAGDPFFFQGHTYLITDRLAVADSDLAIGEVDAPFPEYAPLYERDDEVRRAALVLGKGRWKGDPVFLQGELKGWRYGDSGPAGLRWGTNQITRTVTVTNPEPGGLAGSFLAATFDRAAGAREMHLTYGDSGSPVFLNDCGVWKLAAVASAVDGPFQPTDDPSIEPFLAALFDQGGFSIVPEDEPPERFLETAEDQPSSWYASRVAPHWEELRSLAGLPPVQAPDRPPDLFVWRAEAGPTVIPLSSGSAPDTGEWCVDTASVSGVPVAQDGSMAIYNPSTTLDPPIVDVFRQVLRLGPEASQWATTYVLTPHPLTDRPLVQAAADGAMIILWPVADSSVERVESAPSAGGPWTPWEHGTQRLDSFLAIADPEAGDTPGRFFRLVLVAP